MSDWQVGDLAACVNSGKCPKCVNTCPLPALDEGRIYTVATITSDEQGLLFDLAEFGRDPDWGFCAEHFRKIRPDEHEACEPEFVTLLKRTKVSA